LQTIWFLLLEYLNMKRNNLIISSDDSEDDGLDNRTSFVDDEASRSRKNDNADDSSDGDSSFSPRDRPQKQKQKQKQKHAPAPDEATNYSKNMSVMEDSSCMNTETQLIKISNDSVNVPIEYSTVVDSERLCDTIKVLSHYWVKESLSSKKSSKTQREETKKEREEKIKEFKLSTSQELITHLQQKKQQTSGADIESGNASGKDALTQCKIELQTRLMKVHFKIALYVYIGKILLDANQVKSFFDDTTAKTKFQVGLDKKGLPKLTERKKIKDNFRKQFLKVFTPDWADQEAKSFLRKNCSNNDEEHELSDSGGEEKATEKEEKKTPAKKINLELSKRTADRPQFIKLYVTNTMKHQVYFYKVQ
jgi:hypothetical protein